MGVISEFFSNKKLRVIMMYIVSFHSNKIVFFCLLLCFVSTISFSLHSSQYPPREDLFNNICFFLIDFFPRNIIENPNSCVNYFFIISHSHITHYQPLYYYYPSVIPTAAPIALFTSISI